MSFNVEQKFKAILRRYGHDVLLQRCLDTEQGNAPVNYSDTLERWTAYSVFPGGSSGITHTADEAREGLMFDVDMIFYFQAGINIASEDRIYEEVDRMPDKESMYKVDYAQPLRGVGGKIIYFAAGCTRVNPN